MNVVFLSGVLAGSLFVLILELMIVFGVLFCGLLNIEFKVFFEIFALILAIFLLSNHLKAIFNLNPKAIEIAKDKSIKSSFLSGILWRIASEAKFFIKRFKKIKNK
jgi:hypothetical protein